MFLLFFRKSLSADERWYIPFLLPAVAAGVQSNTSRSNEDKHYRYSAQTPIRLNAGAPSQQTQGRC